MAKELMDTIIPHRAGLVGSVELRDQGGRWEHAKDVMDGDGDLLAAQRSEQVAYLRRAAQAHLLTGMPSGNARAQDLQGKPETLVDELQPYENVLLTKE
jgi:hypothetical protein